MAAVLVLAVLAGLSWLIPVRYRAWAWLVISLGALYILQSPGPDFATVTVVLIIGVWWIVRAASMNRQDSIVLMLCAAVGLLLAVWRGAFGTLAIGLGLTALGGTTLSALIPAENEDNGTRQRLAALWIAMLITALAALKTPLLINFTRTMLVTPSLSWFGFSYIAFRLIHVLIDYQHGRLPSLSLRDFALYVIFFPTLSAGPIDRVQRFVPDALTERAFEPRYLVTGGGRIAWGLFRKFVIADSLTYFALGPSILRAANTPRPLDLWLMLYMYAFYIFFDFAGYTDIAIGIGNLLGLTLPENFRSPYTRSNIAAFWNAWHITLSTWYRDYAFTPLSRMLLRAEWRPVVAAFVAQVGTMILIGLWHGVSWNFAAWGAWHGVGLYVHRRVLTRIQWPSALQQQPWFSRALTFGGVLLTFHFVALGWVFFALPDLSSSLRVFAGLFGIAYGR